MTTLFPGALDNFTDPVGTAMLGATTPKHSEHHANLNDAVEAIEATIGETGSTDPASIEKRLTDVIDASAAAAADAISALAAAALVASDLSTLESSLGTAAYLDAGTAANNVVQLDGASKLPPVDGSQLLNLPGGGGGTSDHDLLTNLDHDTHLQYHNDARGDARYAPLAKGVTNGDAHDHAGGDGAQIAYSSLSGLPTLGTAAAAATGDFEAAGAVSTHNAVTTAHGISAFGATLVDDADAATARTTLGLGSAATTASGDYSPAAHTSDTANPHSVTKSQVGLSAVDNTSDANKPVSTAQQTALNLKANLASPTFTGTVSGITAAMVGAPSGSGTSTGTNTGDSATPAETTATIGTLINGATAKATPVGADKIGIWDSVSGLLNGFTFSNLRLWLFGTATPSAKVDIISNTEQLRLGYDASNQTRFFTDGSGKQTTTLKDGELITLGTGYETITKVTTSDVSSPFFIMKSGNTGLSNFFSCDSLGNLQLNYDGQANGGNITAYSKISSDTVVSLYTAVLDRGSGVGGVGLGISYDFTMENGAGNRKAVGSFVYGWGVPTFGSESVYFAINTLVNGTSKEVFRLYNNEAKFSGPLILVSDTSTTSAVTMAQLTSSWVDSTHATRKAKTRVWAADSSGLREGFCAEADGTQIKTSVNGVAAVARAAALSAEIPGDATRDELRLTELYNACKAFGIIN